MPRLMKTLFAASALVAGLGAASALYADDSHRSHRPAGASERTGQGGMMGGNGMMGRDGMIRDGGMGMGNMMGQASQMMDHCNQMMQGASNGSRSGRPNDQWRKETPKSPGQDG